MKKIVYLLAILLCPFISLSQINYTVKGKALTSNGDLSTGNVIVLNPADSTFIKGTSFFEEAFILENINQAEVLIKLTSLQFQDTIIRVEYNGGTEIDLGEIGIKNPGVDLDVLIVTGRKPVYIQRPDGTVEILIENTMLSASNSVNEILSKSPEMMVDESGGLSVFGKGNAILYLNGKRITNSQLSLISPSNVKKIEIIRNPSSKYDAEGGAVINITTITQIDDGYQGSFKQNISYSDFGGTNTFSSLNLNYKKGKFSSNGYYSLQLGKEKELLFTTRNRDADNVFLSSNLTTEWEYEYDNYSYYGLGLQYDLNKKSYLSLEYSGFIEKQGGNTQSGNDILDSEGASFYESDIDKDEKGTNNSLSMNYKKSLDTLGSSLFVGGQYSKFITNTNDFIIEENMEENVYSSRLLKNLLDLDIDIYSGQIDYTKGFKNSDVLEFGAKYSYVENDFGFDFLFSEDGVNFISDNELSNFFNYKESVGAAYFNFQSSINDKLNYTLGVRSEYTKYDLKLSRAEDQKIKDDYFNFFPNLSISKVLSNNRTINFSYTSRISRAPYQRLNPILIYQDPYTSAQGNPELQPQKTHSFEINTKIKKTSFKIGYNYIIDPFGQTAIRGTDPKSYILKRINYSDQNMFFASASRTFSNKWWRSRNTFSLKYTNITEENLGFERIRPRPLPYFYSNNRFDITKSFKAELLFWYQGDNYEGLHHRQDMYNVSITLEKSFFDRALKCRFIANDIFHSFIASGNYNVGQTEVYYNRRWSTNYFRLSLSYNFGKLKKVSYKNRAIGTTENNRAQ